jgi:hypothetical protein
MRYKLHSKLIAERCQAAQKLEANFLIFNSGKNE